MDYQELARTAVRARKFSYAPYSHFCVGAALLGENGVIYTGCNIENAAYTPTVCAERTAFAKAISEGTIKFRAIAVAGSPEGELTQTVSPCGVCRQMMMEFCDPDTFEIIMVRDKSEDKETDKNNYGYNIKKLKELLPLGFGPANLV